MGDYYVFPFWTRKQETGEDQLKKITEFSGMVSHSVDVIYRKVALIIIYMYNFLFSIFLYKSPSCIYVQLHQILKDSHRQKLDLEEIVARTETQLKELLGLGYSQVIFVDNPKTLMLAYYFFLFPYFISQYYSLLSILLIWTFAAIGNVLGCCIQRTAFTSSIKHKCIQIERPWECLCWWI